ncbi:MAG: metallophosphoesterase family protein, partial [Sphingomonadales bacterium]|nr:metallophosphoesterase family protein [Sphingomonadales bacterium]
MTRSNEHQRSFSNGPASIMILGSAPVLVFGGPYSNLRALQALRSRAAALGVSPSSVICTGDIVAYCAEPEETIAAIRNWGCHVVAGNCEQQLALGADDCGCGFVQGSACDALSKDWYAFASGRISTGSRAWMGQLPSSLWFTYGGFSLRVVHGGIDHINRFLFFSQRPLIAAELACARADVVVAGHAGLPFIRRLGDQVWFNPGVIGMPANDGTPDVWYGIIRGTGDGLSFLTQRLTYDHHGAAAAMREEGYADAYADAL